MFYNFITSLYITFFVGISILILRYIIAVFSIKKAKYQIIKYACWRVIKDRCIITSEELESDFLKYIVKHSDYLMNIFYFGTAIKYEYVDLIVNCNYICDQK